MNKNRSSRLFLSALIFAAPLFFGACGQDYNSNSGDDAFGSLKIDCTQVGNAKLCAAAIVLQSKCFTCHSNWADFTTSQEYIDAGMVVANNISSSLIISRLINSGSNMPPTGTALPTSEYNALVEWITSL